eukprot:11355723-Alexandrium_andersonii.AAC.1
MRLWARPRPLQTAVNRSKFRRRSIGARNRDRRGLGASMPNGPSGPLRGSESAKVGDPHAA